MRIVWSQEAQSSLAAIYDYIWSRSPQNAEMVIDNLIALVDTLADERFDYALEPFINNNKYRFIAKWSYKIIYERRSDFVLIVDIFHSRQNPEKLRIEE